MAITESEKTPDGQKFVLTCERCGGLFKDAARRRVCRACSGRVPYRTVLSWREVARQYTQQSGEHISPAGARAVGSVAIRKLRRLIQDDDRLALDLSESGLPFMDLKDRDES